MAESASKNKKRSIIAASVILVLIILTIILYFTGAYEALIVKLGILQEQEVTPKSTFFEYVPKGVADMTVLDDNLMIADESGISCFLKIREDTAPACPWNFSPGVSSEAEDRRWTG